MWKENQRVRQVQCSNRQKGSKSLLLVLQEDAED
nr:MAG TPA: hypothetical protein [Bacteriophage sp.]